MFDFFYSIGDDLLSGSVAKYLQRKNKKKLDNIQLYENRKLAGGIEIPKAKSYLSIFERVGGNKNSLAFKLAKKSFWFGILGTTLCMGILTPLLNIYYTRAKIQRELAE